MLKQVIKLDLSVCINFGPHKYPLLCAVKTPSDKEIRVMSSACHQNT